MRVAPFQFVCLSLENNSPNLLSGPSLVDHRMCPDDPFAVYPFNRFFCAVDELQKQPFVFTVVERHRIVVFLSFHP